MAIIVSNNTELFPNGSGSHLLWENRAEGATITTNATNSTDIDFAFDEVGILFSLKYFPTIAPNLPSLWPEAKIFIAEFEFQQ